jgi:hypothetical protein
MSVLLKHIVTNLDSIKNTSVPEGLVSELTIGAVHAEDGGIYTCFARNEFGHDQTAMHLLVQGMYFDTDILE